MTRKTLLEAILTNTTCGLTCWYAKEEVCRCSCGGDNHGCMLDEEGAMPDRMAKIDGFMYRLEAVGKYTEINNLADLALKSLGWRRIESKITYGDGSPYHYGHYAKDAGSAIRVKTAADNQKKWPEVEKAGTQYPYMLWVLPEQPEPVWCDPIESCDRCLDRAVLVWDYAGRKR